LSYKLDAIILCILGHNSKIIKLLCIHILSEMHLLFEKQQSIDNHLYSIILKNQQDIANAAAHLLAEKKFGHPISHLKIKDIEFQQIASSDYLDFYYYYWATLIRYVLENGHPSLVFYCTEYIQNWMIPAFESSKIEVGSFVYECQMTLLMGFSGVSTDISSSPSAGDSNQPILYHRIKTMIPKVCLDAFNMIDLYKQ
jgi:hypothetical protein